MNTFFHVTIVVGLIHHQEIRNSPDPDKYPSGYLVSRVHENGFHVLLLVSRVHKHEKKEFNGLLLVPLMIYFWRILQIKNEITVYMCT